MVELIQRKEAQREATGHPLVPEREVSVAYCIHSDAHRINNGQARDRLSKGEQSALGGGGEQVARMHLLQHELKGHERLVVFLHAQDFGR